MKEALSSAPGVPRMLSLCAPTSTLGTEESEPGITPATLGKDRPQKLERGAPYLQSESSQLPLYTGDRSLQRGWKCVWVTLAYENAHVRSQPLGVNPSARHQRTVVRWKKKAA
jgi:hypothetical protein